MQSKIKYLIIIINVFIAYSFSSCGDTPVDSMQSYVENQAPVITSFVSSVSDITELSPDMELTLEVTAYDPEGDVLTFEYSANYGTFSHQEKTSTGSTITYHTPDVLPVNDDMVITVVTKDSKGFTTNSEIVFRFGNREPVITSFTSNFSEQSEIIPGMAVQLQLSAHDPDGDTLSYTFSSNNGTFSNQVDNVNGSIVTYYLPQSISENMQFIVTIRIDDGNGGITQTSLNLGTGQIGAALSVIGTVKEYMKPDEIQTLQFSSTSAGAYQLVLLDNHMSSVPAFDEKKASYSYNPLDGLVDIKIGGPLSFGAHIQLGDESSAPDKVCIIFKDTLNRETSLSYVISVDGTGPESTVTINDGDSATLSQDVTLNISSSDSNSGIASMMISNNSAFEGAVWEDYSDVKNWILDSGSGIKTVYVKIIDTAGNERIITATIFLNDSSDNDNDNGLAFTITGELNPYMRADEIQTLQFSHTISGSLQLVVVENSVGDSLPFNNKKANFYYDPVDGIIDLKIGGPASTGVHAQLLNSSGSSQKVYIIFRDTFMQESSVVYSIMFDGTPPQVDFNINGGYLHTNSVSVILNLSASDSASGVDSMMISNYSNFSGAVLENYSSFKSWTLNGGDGLKTVYVKVIDSAGNENTISKNITLDMNPPIISSFVADADLFHVERDVALIVDASDTVGIANWLVNETGDVNDGTWLTEKPLTYRVSDTMGEKNLYVFARDAAGNISASAQTQIYYVSQGYEDTMNWNKEFSYQSFPLKLMNVAINSEGNIFVIITDFANASFWSPYSGGVIIKKFNPSGQELLAFSEGSNGNCDSSDFPCSTNGLDRVIAPITRPHMIATYGVDYYNNDRLMVYESKFDSNDNLYLAGFVVDFAQPPTRATVIKINANGVIDDTTPGWGDAEYRIGDNKESAFQSISIDSGDNIFIGGYGVSIVERNNGSSINYDWWIKKYNSSGIEQSFTNGSSACEADGSQNPCTYSGSDIAFEAYDGGKIYSSAIKSNSIYFFGAASNIGGSGDQNAWLMRFDFSGSKLWDKNFDDDEAASGGVIGYDIKIDENYNIYLLTQRSDSGDSSVTIYKLNENGVNQDIYPYDTIANDTGYTINSTSGKEMNISFPGDDGLHGNCLTLDMIGNLFVGGHAKDASGPPNTNAWLMKMTTDGVIDISGGDKFYNGSNYDEVYDMVIDSENNVYIVGVYYDTGKVFIKKLIY